MIESSNSRTTAAVSNTQILERKENPMILAAKEGAQATMGLDPPSGRSDGRTAETSAALGCAEFAISPETSVASPGRSSKFS
jgi:hypothetical protein